MKNNPELESMKATQKYFSSKENCYMDMRYVRNLYNTRTTEEQAKAANKALHLMIIYCPSELIGMVEATIHEFEWRMNYVGLNINYGEGVSSDRLSQS